MDKKLQDVIELLGSIYISKVREKAKHNILTKFENNLNYILEGISNDEDIREKIKIDNHFNLLLCNIFEEYQKLTSNIHFSPPNELDKTIDKKK